jgi:hypothetical protein
MLTKISYGTPFCSLVTKRILNSVSCSLHLFIKSYNLKSLNINTLSTTFYPQQQQNGKVQGKFHPIISDKDTEGAYMYTSTLYLTSELYGVGIDKRALISCCIVKGTRPTGRSPRLVQIIRHQEASSDI